MVLVLMEVRPGLGLGLGLGLALVFLLLLLVLVRGGTTLVNRGLRRSVGRYRIIIRSQA